MANNKEEIQAIIESITKKAINVANKIIHVNPKNGRCNAHLYRLEQQGDSLKSRYIYRCKRPGCHHYSTLHEIEGRSAQCKNCGNVFYINNLWHTIKNIKGLSIPEIMVEYPVCCNEEPKTEIRERENLDFLEE